MHERVLQRLVRVRLLAVLKDDSSAARDFIYRANSSVMKTWYAAGTSGWRFDVADEISHNWWHDLRPYAKAGKSTGPLVGEVWYDASSTSSATSSTR
ncbi:MAG: hypothetical protein IPH03_08580 [Tetrasphaera sp.]|nr:hypothetical protein [Tetrasphaera sp.]